ncbi:hypothetical protein HAX54_028998, partial [Datura stramonium]|nr:hypothetical protein [Datura stramonium]
MAASGIHSTSITSEIAFKDFPLLSTNVKEQAPQNYVNNVRNIGSLHIINESIQIKSVKVVKGVPSIRWREAEVQRMNVYQNLQLAAIGKFSYGWPNLERLRK